MTTAAEIATLARATNLLDEAALVALTDAIGARLQERRAAGESVAMERALRASAHQLHETMRRFQRELLEHESELAALRGCLTSETGRTNRWDLERVKAPSFLAGRLAADRAAWDSMIDLYEATADLVRATDDERAAALAEQAAAQARVEAHAAKVGKPARKKGKR